VHTELQVHAAVRLEEASARDGSRGCDGASTPGQARRWLESRHQCGFFLNGEEIRMKEWHLFGGRKVSCKDPRTLSLFYLY
jgi:hypothetical protein